MEKRRSFLTVLLVLVALYLTAKVLAGRYLPRFEHESKKHSLAAEFAAKDIGGTNHALIDYRGRVVVLSFWSIHCPPCLDELPDLIAFQKKYDLKQVRVLTINTDDEDPAEIQKAIEEYQIDLPVILDRQVDFELSRAYGVRALPTNFFIDRSGNIAEHYLGVVPWLGSRVEGIVAELLAAKASQ